MTDDLNDTLKAPPREMKLPELGRIVTLKQKHRDLLEQLAKANDKREEAIARLRRADDRVRDVRKAIARSTVRLKAQYMLDAMPNLMSDDPLGGNDE